MLKKEVNVLGFSSFLQTLLRILHASFKAVPVHRNACLFIWNVYRLYHSFILLVMLVHGVAIFFC